jgi:hypothetical protein
MQHCRDKAALKDSRKGKSNSYLKEKEIFHTVSASSEILKKIREGGCNSYGSREILD